MGQIRFMYPKTTRTVAPVNRQFGAAVAVLFLLLLGEGTNAWELDLDNLNNRSFGSVIEKKIDDVSKMKDPGVTPNPNIQSSAERNYLKLQFTGGLMGDSMAEALQVLRHSLGDELFYEPILIDGFLEGKGECEFLVDRLLPSGQVCTDNFVFEVRRLHRIGSKKFHDPAAFSSPVVGSRYYIPLLRFNKSATNRGYDLSNKQDKTTLRRIEKNWVDVITKADSFVVNEPSLKSQRTIEVRKILTVTWNIPLSETVGAEELDRTLFDLNLIKNIAAFSSKYAEEQTPKRYTFSPNDAFRARDNGDSLKNNEGDYLKLLPGFHESAGNLQCEAGFNASIVLIDTKIAPNPDLLVALGKAVPGSVDLEKAANPRINRTFSTEEHHGTYLAGIVASSHNNVGLSGVSQEGTSLNSIVYQQKGSIGDPDAKLYETLNRLFDPEKSELYLFAGEFLPYPHDTLSESQREKMWSRPGWLIDDEMRFRQKPLNKFLSSSGAIFIVAAGQQSLVGQDGIAIGKRTPSSPQNLGDLDNVIVVAACEECNSNATLWKQSNFSEQGEPSGQYFVHVMAPGGQIIPGLMSEDEIGETIGGTSAASAFVAGLAANMVACHPSYRFAPKKLKEWLLLSARPDRDTTVRGRVASGVIDPQLAMLDPKKNWLMRNNQNFVEVSKVKWCSEVFRLEHSDDQNAPPEYFGTRNLRRLTQVGDKRFVASQLYNQESQNTDKIRFRQFGPGQINGDTKIAAIEAGLGQPCTIASDEIADLFTSEENHEVADCSQIVRCSH